MWRGQGEGMSPACDIDKARRGGETWPVDPELREALEQLGTNLRGEVRSVDAGLREALNQVVVDLRGEIRESESRMRGEIRQSESRMRLHFDVVGESLRSDIRAVAEGMFASREQTDRRIDEQAGRTDGLQGRVVRLEVRVTDLKDGRKSRRPRRRR